MDYVWIKPETDGDFDLPFGACVIENFHNRYKIRDDNGKELHVPGYNILRPMHPSCIKDVEDMIMLGDLQEYTILRNLELRYRKNLIYTYTGNVLIAVNPYQHLSIYGDKIVRMYRGRKMGELPPHLFAVGDVSYENMRLNNMKQCIIINGESGAGKTHSAKILLQYYASVTGKHSGIEEQVLESNPVLEAFGNAKTIRNDNSSRFGKYISINFSWDGYMEQAEIKQFLLEKSRIVMQCKGERNYHIFYILLNGLSQKEKDLLGLKEITCYRYLSGEGDKDISKKDSGTQFETIMKALKTLNFSNALIWNIFELLAAILHFGNINYKEELKFGLEAVEVLESNELNLLSTLVGVPTKYLKTCLSKRTITVGPDTVKKELNKQEAIDTRDAFVKAIYGNLFNFIVKKINETTRKPNTDANAYIGVLDVFGFENYTSNSFEQLCINLANEQLQQFFIRHTFKLEQRQYIEEGISWKSIDFVDNRDIIDMISMQNMNIFSIINDESKFPSSTDETLLSKLVEHHGDNQYFLQPKFKNIQVFGIKHFAGVVLYDMKDFLEKNRDSYSCDFLNLAKMTENAFLKMIFTDDIQQPSHLKKTTHMTSATKFRNSLDELMSELHECHPFFIRCIKPNDIKQPNVFNRILCCQQLRYSGIWETSKIRQVGYSIRYSYREFVARYGVLKPGLHPTNRLTQEELKEATRDICISVLQSRLENQFGYMKIFLKNKEYLELENKREAILSEYVIIIQKTIRRWLYRRRFIKMRNAAITIQKYWRCAKHRRRYQFWRHGVLRLQSAINSRYQRQSYLRFRRTILRFQARCKGFAVRRRFHQEIQKRRGQKSYAAPEKVERKPVPKKASYSTRTIAIKQDSFVHGRLRPQERLEEESRFVDDSFHFLNDHSRMKKLSKQQFRL